MEYYPDSSTDSLNDRLDVVMRLLDAATALSYAKLHPSLTPGTHDYSMGKKYTRVYQTWSDGQRSVCFFVENATGDVWKAAGWKGPALNFPRGNINTPEGRWELSGGKISESGYFYPAF